MRDAVTHRLAGDLAIPANRLPRAPLELLPQTAWWKLFIDRKYHVRNDPWLLFDRDMSSGFHAVMMRVFRTHLGPDSSLGTRLSFALYERLYSEVSAEVGGIVNRGRSGTDAPPGPTRYPMEYPPSALALTELFAEGMGTYDLVQDMRRTAPNETVCYMVSGCFAGQVSVRYKMADVPALADGIFNRFYNELNSAIGSPADKLRAIVRCVRGLHVHHFFRDANGRLNTMVVLNKLLMESGFPPAILCDPAIFGGAFEVDALARKVIDAMRRVLRLMQEESVMRKY